MKNDLIGNKHRIIFSGLSVSIKRKSYFNEVEMGYPGSVQNYYQIHPGRLGSRILFK